MTFLLFLFLDLIGGSSAHAVTPIIWTQDTQEAFGKGEAESVSITRDGEIRLGPTLTRFADTGEEFVWSIAGDASSGLYVGTGSEGRVYRLSDGRSELVFDSPERAIFALVVLKDGTVYAGSSPGGLIYELPARGEPKTLARTDDEHVWVLIEDGKGGLYAATGGRVGRVLRVSKSGDVEAILQTSDPNVTSLIRGADGTLYAGTDQSGMIYRVVPSGAVDVLYDTSENEVKALALAGDGSLLAGTMNSAVPSAKRPAGNPTGRDRGAPSQGGQSVVYSVLPSGSGWRLWDVPAPTVQALAPSKDGSVTVVTGGGGRVYKLFPDGSHSLVATVDEAQPWAFLEDGAGGGWIASSGSGEVFRLGGLLAKTGILTSEVEDYSLITRWGRIGWDGDTPSGTGVSFDVRSGNSEVPDDTWSDWSSVPADGSIPAREARYIQHRTTLTGNGKSTPAIREIALSGLPENVRPMVLDLTIRGPHQDKANTGGGGENGGGRRSGPPPGEGNDGWVISWTGADVNNDQLTYTLHFKGRQDKVWKLLEDALTGNSYTWDTESAPEGTVLVRLRVSDEGSNPKDMALSSERVSAPFKIDHTEPVVQVSSIESTEGGVRVSGSISDETSTIKSAAYSLNSGDWNVFFPTDRVFDSSIEQLSLNLDELTAGEYTIVIRATDTRGNVGVAKRLFDVK